MLRTAEHSLLCLTAVHVQDSSAGRARLNSCCQHGNPRVDALESTSQPEADWTCFEASITAGQAGTVDWPSTHVQNCPITHGGCVPCGVSAGGVSSWQLDIQEQVL